MQAGGELWRKNVLYDIMDGKSDMIVAKLEQDPELKRWKCKQAGDECVGFTLLHAAVRFSNEAALDVLLQNGAVYILEKGKGGKTPFDWAILNSEPRMVKAMLDCAAAGHADTPDIERALADAEAQLTASERSGTKVAEATETRDLIKRLADEAEAARRAREAAGAARAAEVVGRMEEEVARSKQAAEAAAAAAARKMAEDRRKRLAAQIAAQEAEAERQAEEARLAREAEEEAAEAERNARELRAQMLFFAKLVESSLLRRGIGRTGPIIVVRVRPLSPPEYATDPASALADVDGAGFEPGVDEPGVGRLAPSADTQALRYSLGDRLFGCNSLHWDRDEVYGAAEVPYANDDAGRSYLEVGGTIVDSMTRGTNCTVIACGARGAGKSYALGRPFHRRPYERASFDADAQAWTSGELVRSDDAGLVDRTGRDLMAYRAVLQAAEPYAKLVVVMSILCIYHERLYDLLAPDRAAVLGSSKRLKIVGQPVKEGGHGRGVYVQGLTPRIIAQEKPPPKRAASRKAQASSAAPGGGGKERSVRGWLKLADANRLYLAKELKAGDKGLRRACVVTMFEVLQISDAVKAEERRGRRAAAARPTGAAGGMTGGMTGGRASRAAPPHGSQGQQKTMQLLYSSITLVDLPGAAIVPAEDAVRAKEDAAITKMQSTLSKCIDLTAQQQQQGVPQRGVRGGLALGQPIEEGGGEGLVELRGERGELLEQRAEEGVEGTAHGDHFGAAEPPEPLIQEPLGQLAAELV